jgi:hypothetical protein
MHNIVLIEKYGVSSSCWSYLQKNNAIPEVSVEEIVSKYQGFEGELIYIFSANENNIKDILVSTLSVSVPSHFLLIHVISNSRVVPQFIKGEGFKCGYDVGVCEQEKTIYSSIFNEILFGHLHELVTYKNFLNENLLFPDKTLAEDYVRLHNQLSAQGKGVEDYEEMIVYEIWKENLT